MPGGSGLDLARKAREIAPESFIIIMTAYADVTGVIEAMRLGVLDYLLKPLNFDTMLLRLKLIREGLELREEVRRLRAELNDVRDSNWLLGNSRGMQEIRRLIEQIAASKGTVLINGESGTGKEIAARQIHALSPQRENKFVAVNCGAIPEHLLESELFGHKKGSFTGATQDKAGLFFVANGGTIFLDEIGDMPKNLQVKILRVIQEREITPVGGTEPKKVDLRSLLRHIGI